MYKIRTLLYCMVAYATTVLTVSAKELRVNPYSEEAGDFATIQSALDTAEPGDIIEVRGGVYHEHLVVKKGGTATAPITIRPMENQRVLIQAGAPLEIEWQPVSGMPEVYRGQVDPAWTAGDSGIWETPSRLRLLRVQSVQQVANRRGAWYHDEQEHAIYIRSSGHASANQLLYWLESADKPAIRVQASHVHIRGLNVALGQHGILLDKGTEGVVVESVRAYCNALAGIHVSGKNHRIAYNETFQNNTYGIQLRYEMVGIQILNNLCYMNGAGLGALNGNSVPTDLGIYGQGWYNVFHGNVIDGFSEDVFRNKHAGNPTNLFVGNVVRGNFTTGHYGVYGNTMIVEGLGMRSGMFRNGHGHALERSWENVDATGELRANNLIYPLAAQEDPKFADLAYRDFRLQGDTPYAGKGAFKDNFRVFYVNPENGSDQSDGRSIGKAFATLAHALQALSAGDTLYLLPGVYADPVIVETGGLSSLKPLRIRAYGRENGVELTGGMRIAGSRFVEVEGLQFRTHGVVIEGSEGVRIRNSRFTDLVTAVSVEKSSGSSVDRSVFDRVETGIRVRESRYTCAVENVYVGKSTVYDIDDVSLATWFSNWNWYEHVLWASASDHTWIGLRAWQIQFKQDENSGEGDAGAQTIDYGFLKQATSDHVAQQLAVHNLRVAGVGTNNVSLLWESPRTATIAEVALYKEDGNEIRRWISDFVYQVFGRQFDMLQIAEGYYVSGRHTSVSGLDPNTRYYAEVTLIDMTGNRGQPERVEWQTLANEAGRKIRHYYVSPEGNDSNAGISREEPWQSFAHAMDQLTPGDELVLLPGVYHETIRPRVSGTKDYPIRIRSEVPGKAVIDMEQILPIAVEVLNVDYVELDGLRIAGGIFPNSLAYLVLNAEGITIRNGDMAYPEGSSYERLKLGYKAGVLAHNAKNLLVTNNLFLCAITGVSLSNSDGSSVLNNTIVGEGNYGVVIIAGSEDESHQIYNNLFCRPIMGYKSNPAIWVFGYIPQLMSDYNLFYYPQGYKGTVGKNPITERLMLKEWQEATGLDQHSLEATPQFKDPVNADFSLLSDSPGYKGAGDGEDIGRRILWSE